MKSTITFLSILIFYTAKSQLRPPEFYVEGSGFFEEQFEPLSSYYAIGVGTEPLSYKFIALDLNYTFYFGGDEDEQFDDFDRDGEIDFRSRLYRDFWAWNFGVGPKLIFEDDYLQFVIMPKYHFAQQTAKGDFADSEGLDLGQKIKFNSNHWSLALGFEFMGEEKVGKFGVYLHYTRFNAGKSLNQLDFENQGYTNDRYNTPDIGITFRVSSGFKKRKDFN